MANAVVSVGRSQPDNEWALGGHRELLGLLGGQEKGSEGYKGDGISIKDGMVEPCAVRSNCGSCWGAGGGTFGRHGQEPASTHEDLTSSRGSWLLGRKGGQDVQASRDFPVRPAPAHGPRHRVLVAREKRPVGDRVRERDGDQNHDHELEG
ncbi:hypothetical protein KVR01_011447 [Diaporthe batatas]|uniref:uncharacterized protein n=1 Tax=Diaporthe batatas TaxID=748121 RepID=UPI001D0413B6|nr:uncharacterized protein KVR01_011447 [Diaporthe batatas]KAG8159004.1 hypothetical protein KVR01_011447 [Diaporthe batatas]